MPLHFQSVLFLESANIVTLLLPYKIKRVLFLVKLYLMHFEN